MDEAFTLQYLLDKQRLRDPTLNQTVGNCNPVDMDKAATDCTPRAVQIDKTSGSSKNDVEAEKISIFHHVSCETTRKTYARFAVWA